jgi:hypothetical protein
MHAAFLGEQISFPRIAGTARRHHVGPLVVSTAGERDQMIPSEAFAVAELPLSPVTVLAAVAVASEEECVGDLTAEAAGYVHELDETDDGGFRQCQSFTSDYVAGVRLDDLGFPLDDETKGSPERDHG